MNANDYVSINRKVLHLAGLYPVDIFRYIVCIFCLFLIIVPQVAQIYRYRDDLGSVLETSSVLFTIALALVKSTVWICNRRKIEFFINYMLTDYWKLVRSDEAGQHLKVYATYARNITKGYLFLICNSLIFFFSLPVIDKLILLLKASDDTTKHFPFVGLYPESFYISPYYQLAYVSQIVATSVCGIMILATDTLIATALLHTSGHFKVLQKEFQHLDTNIRRLHVGSTSKDAVHIDKIKLQWSRIIKHHQIVLWFCDMMESNFSPILFLQTLASSLIICLVALQVSTTLTERANIVKYFSYLLMALFQLLMFCYPGDILLQQSSAMSIAAYSIKWYDSVMPLKTEVSLVMLRAQKPCRVTAGGFYVMHLENFNAVLSTAVSYFMLIRSLNLDNS